MHRRSRKEAGVPALADVVFCVDIWPAGWRQQLWLLQMAWAVFNYPDRRGRWLSAAVGEKAADHLTPIMVGIAILAAECSGIALSHGDRNLRSPSSLEECM